jgi:hypothetical protein
MNREPKGWMLEDDVKRLSHIVDESLPAVETDVSEEVTALDRGSAGLEAEAQYEKWSKEGWYHSRLNKVRRILTMGYEPLKGLKAIIACSAPWLSAMMCMAGCWR